MRLESLWRDIRFAFRIFKRSPAVALTVIGTLAVALGLNATAYSFFNAYVVTPAAVRDPGRCTRRPGRTAEALSIGSRGPRPRSSRRDMAGRFPETYVSMPQLLTRINGRPAMGELVTGDYFSLLGVPAFRGRMLRPSDSGAPARAGRRPQPCRVDAPLRGDPAAVGQQVQIRRRLRRDCRLRSRGLRRPGPAPARLLGAADAAARARRGAEPLRPEQPQRLDMVGRLGATQTEASARAAGTGLGAGTTASNPRETQAAVALLQPAATPIALVVHRAPRLHAADGRVRPRAADAAANPPD